MKYFFILTCSLFLSIQTFAQDFITDDQIANTVMVADDELKVLYFTASWCGPCRMMKPGIEKMAADPNAVATIYKLDIDNNISDEILEVPGVPTFMFVKNGSLVGQHTGAVSDRDLKMLFEKHDAIQPSSKLLAYKPVPSKYTIVSGAHPKLSKKNLATVWHNKKNLSTVGWSIYKNLNDPKDLNAGLTLVNRAIELEPTSDLYYLKSNLLSKLGSKKEALSTALKARKLMESNKQFTGDVDRLIRELKS